MQSTAHTPINMAWVSILVFLELALGFILFDPISPAFVSFNPCFLGTCPRMADYYGGVPLDVVSILVFLELALGFSSFRISLAQRRCFNPCFLGTCPRICNVVWVNCVYPCFNPCFLGTCPRIKKAIFESGPFVVSILVFLELALGFRYMVRNMMKVSDGFNPCFLGTCPRIFGPEN